MFSVLCVQSPPKKLFSKRICAVEALLSPVKGAAPFKVINVTPGKKGIDWKTVSAAAGCSGRSMLVPSAVEVPLSAGIERFVPRVLPLLILLNTVAVRYAGEGAQRRRMLVVDRGAVLTDYICRVVPCAAKITVVTDYPERYYPCCADIMEQFGAALRICGSVEESEKFDIGVAEEKVSNSSISFSMADMDKLLIPAGYLRMCPQGIEPFIFVCALFECSGLAAVGELTLSDV